MEGRRIIGILTSEHAKDRLTQAMSLAKAGIPQQEAIAILKSLPVAMRPAGQPSPEFAAAMASMQANQEVGADDGGEDLTEREVTRRLWARARKNADA